MKFVTGAKFVLGLLCCLVLPAYGHLDNAYSHDPDDPFTDRSQWMKTIRDDVQLSEMALPGTHDSATFQATWYPIFKDVVETQTLGFDKQLEYGIRVFDLRIRRTADHLALNHGWVYLDKNLGAALEAIDRFLRDNPSETVLFRVRDEYEADSDVTHTLEQVFDSYMQRFSGIYLKTQNPRLTLGEARGKFVVLSADGRLNKFGLRYSDGGVFNIQDEYSMSSNWALHDKYIKIKQQLHNAAAGSRDTFYVNYLSASHRSFPYFVASGHVSPGTGAARLWTGLMDFGHSDLYPKLPRTGCTWGVCFISFEGTNVLTRDDLKELNDQSTQVRTVGIVMADFPGDSLIDNVIRNNYRRGHDLSAK
ncbi:phosphatidylinositol-specific phospholipase C [Pseudomonas umsongensis]|jgi:1-phosphatidylinositol phosphodiesterase|uniref:phosphatidylinositol-specific phospholipase C n=1 Tax=Pseudomonas umsongensis TaxID=198618 RepID=UPI0015B8FDCD|nr:phosphatidylinositol-specific phospholipase C [Pseudomonas umsongensis]NWL21797.1 phospholipase [Pseudomonas umsongensis]